MNKIGAGYIWMLILTDKWVWIILKVVLNINYL